MTEKWTKYVEAMQLRDQALVNLALLSLAICAAWLMYGWSLTGFDSMARFRLASTSMYRSIRMQITPRRSHASAK